jgi:predicted permease
MPDHDHRKELFSRPHLWLIALAGVIVPRRLRADWRQEWEAELRSREALLADWDRLDWRNKFDLLRRSVGAFWDALCLQPRRQEDEMFQDIRYGYRMLLKYRGLTVVAVITLGIGIGANTAIFSLINKALLRPLPVVAEQERVFAVNHTTKRGWVFTTFSYPNYRDLRDRNDVMAGLIAYEFAPANLSYDGINERVWGYLVSGNYFETLGARAAIGRLISPEEDRLPDAHPVVVISHRCWQRRFGGDPSVVGRELIVNGRGFTVIGVAPQQFIGLEVSYAPEVWFPLMMRGVIRRSAAMPQGPGKSWLEDREGGELFVAGRLKPGASPIQAEDALKTIAAQLAREHPNENEGKTIKLSTPGLFGEVGRRPVMGFSGVLMGVVALVLLLVCTNLANLLLARAMDRRKEIAVRLALGAGRWRVVRQLLTESLLLSMCGGALGWRLALQLTGAAGEFKAPMALSTELNMDWRVLVFAIAITFLTSAAFGLLPALQATRPELVPALKDDAMSLGHRRSWLRGALVVAQVALSLVLMISAGLMLRGLQRSQYINLGFNPQHAVKLSVNLDLQGYDRERGEQFQRQILDRVRAMPGVRAAGVGNYVPPDLHVAVLQVKIEGRPEARGGEAPLAGSASASPGYFQALGARLLAGRDFIEQDDERSVRVAVVNETFARSFWPEQNALNAAVGKRFSLPDRDNSLIQVVGVVEDGKYRNLSEASRPFVFTPLKQSYNGLSTVVARTSSDEANTIAAIHRELRQLDPHLPVYDAKTLTEHLELPLLPARITASMLGAFGLLSLFLAAVGVFGVMSYVVSRRAHEIGVRLALGAKPGALLGLLLRQGMTPVALGVALGLIGALGLTRLMSSLLFGVSPTDLLTFTGVALLLVTVALLACYIPARRAMKVDLAASLRHE